MKHEKTALTWADASMILYQKRQHRKFLIGLSWNKNFTVFRYKTDLSDRNITADNFHSHTAHLDIIKVLLPTDAQKYALKRLLKFTLKMLQHVSV